jgi:DNA polymerase I-like protein with 3'-5' exonuclease and polymerase domains
VKEAERFQSRWFGEHPGIAKWHERIEDQLMLDRTVRNKFGYHRQYFNRIEHCLNEALGWIPQPTVAIIISKAMIALDAQAPWIQLLMQVHDSIIHQFPFARKKEALLTTNSLMEIVVPYDDPLIIPVDAAVSPKSWGHCKEIPWPEAA